MNHILFALLPLWTAAMAIKATLALRAGEPYQFRMWDGGLLLSGKHLSLRATQIRMVATVLLTAYSAALYTRHISFHLGKTICLALLAVLIVTDFACAKHEREEVIPLARVDRDGDE